MTQSTVVTKEAIVSSFSLKILKINRLVRSAGLFRLSTGHIKTGTVFGITKPQTI